MKKLLLTLLVGMFLISLVCADLGTYKQSECVLVKGNLNATSVNVSIYYPNSTLARSNVAMSNIGGDIWNYTFCNTTTLGIYIYDYCNENGANCRENFFEVTPSGREAPSSGEGMIYLASIGAMVLITIFFFCLSFTIKPESALRFGFIGFSFVMTIITVLYSFVAINETLAGFTTIIDRFSNFYFVLLIVVFVIFILVLLSLTFRALEGLKLKRGLKPED